MPKTKSTDDTETTANAAVRAEAEGSDDITFDWDDETWILGSGDSWPLAASIAFSEIADSKDNPGRSTKYVAEFCKGVLGPVQWRKFETKPGRTAGHLNELYVEIFKAYGFTAGE